MDLLSNLQNVHSMLLMNVSVENCLPPAGHHSQKVISPASFSGEGFFSDASLQSPSYPTGASAFVSPPDSGKLKHSHSCSKITPKAIKPHKSSSGGGGGSGRGLSSVEESGEWVKALSSVSPQSMNFYKGTEDPKKHKELSSKAKEQHRDPKKTEGQRAKEMAGRSKTKMSPTSPGTVPQAAVLQHPEHRQEPLQRSGDWESRPSLKGPESRRGPEADREGHRTKPGLQQDRQAEHYRTSCSRHPRQTPPARNSSGPDSRQSQTNPTSREHRTTRSDAGESPLAYEGRQRTTGSEVSSRDANFEEHRFFYSKEAGRKRGSSRNSIPDTLQGLKAPLGPGPWKVPSSAKILSEAEALRDPL